MNPSPRFEFSLVKNGNKDLKNFFRKAPKKTIWDAVTNKKKVIPKNILGVELNRSLKNNIILVK